MTEREAQLECDRLAKLTGGKVSMIACNHAGCPWRFIVTQHIEIGQAAHVVQGLGGSCLQAADGEFLTWCPTHQAEWKAYAVEADVKPAWAVGAP